MKGCKRCATNVDSAFDSEKDIICKSCREDLKKNLGKCEDWEINKKQLIEKLLAEEGNDLEYAKELHEGGNTYKICQKCGEFTEIINNFGDNKEIEHNHHTELDHNQIKSNQIKSNQIKSNQIKSNQSVNQDTNSSKNYLPWILGGIGLVSLVGVLVWFLIRRNKGNNN